MLNDILYSVVIQTNIYKLLQISQNHNFKMLIRMLYDNLKLRV